MSLRQGDKHWRAGPGDMLWIRADEIFVYEANERCVTFYSTCPLHMLDSTKRIDALPKGEPETVG